MPFGFSKKNKRIKRFVEALEPDKKGYVYLVPTKEWLLDVCFLEQLMPGEQFRTPRSRARTCVKAVSRQPKLRLKQNDFVALLQELPEDEVDEVLDSLLMDSKGLRRFVVMRIFMSGREDAAKDSLRKWFVCEPERMSARVIQRRKLFLEKLDKHPMDTLSFKEVLRTLKDWTLRDIRLSTSTLIRKQAQHFKGSEPTLMVLQVDIGGGVRKSIRLHEHDNAGRLAQLFVHKHKLDPGKTRVLAKLIKKHQKKAVKHMRREEERRLLARRSQKFDKRKLAEHHDEDSDEEHSSDSDEEFSASETFDSSERSRSGSSSRSNSYSMTVVVDLAAVSDVDDEEEEEEEDTPQDLIADAALAREAGRESRTSSFSSLSPSEVAGATIAMAAVHEDSGTEDEETDAEEEEEAVAVAVAVVSGQDEQDPGSASASESESSRRELAYIDDGEWVNESFERKAQQQHDDDEADEEEAYLGEVVDDDLPELYVADSHAHARVEVTITTEEEEECGSQEYTEESTTLHEYKEEEEEECDSTQPPPVTETTSVQEDVTTTSAHAQHHTQESHTNANTDIDAT